MIINIITINILVQSVEVSRRQMQVHILYSQTTSVTAKTHEINHQRSANLSSVIFSWSLHQAVFLVVRHIIYQRCIQSCIQQGFSKCFIGAESSSFLKLHVYNKHNTDSVWFHSGWIRRRSPRYGDLSCISMSPQGECQIFNTKSTGGIYIMWYKF